MLRFLKMLVVCLALAGLPVHAVAAAGMAYCTPDQHAHTHGDDDAHVHAFLDQGDSQPPLPGVAGDHVLCHHCTAAVLPALQQQAGVAAAALHTPRPPAHFFVFFPEQPQRPPLA
jgi:hypothetical protein